MAGAAKAKEEKEFEGRAFAVAVEEFAQAFVNGATQREAYIASHPNTKSQNANALRVRACEFMKRPEVQARIQHLQAEAARHATLSRDELAEMMSEEIKRSYEEQGTLIPVMKVVDSFTRICGYDRQVVDVKANVTGAFDVEDAAAHLKFLLDKASKGAAARGDD